MDGSTMIDVLGLPKLLRAVAEKLENGANPLNKELLMQSADRLERLEEATGLLYSICNNVPTDGEGSKHSKVSRDTLRCAVALLRGINGYENVRTLRR